MCGIAGYYSFGNNQISNREILNLFQSIKHRGPDGSGQWISKKKDSLLINVRLAIQDLNRLANQPIKSTNGNFIIIFNGEIYNYKKLKLDLLKDYNFKTESDTEVILALYIKYKENCVNFLEGMFSFAIMDINKNEFFLARDPFGIKPLYYHISKNNFWFSSEIKSFSKISSKLVKNEKIIFDYLNSEYYENVEETFYKNIYKVKPGYFYIISKNGIKKTKYWHFDKELNKIKIPNKKKDKEFYFKDLIYNTVKNSFVSQVPISIATSGGLDSSIILDIANKAGYQVEAESFIFNEKNFSEFKFIQKTLKKNKISGNQLIITPDKFLKNYKEIISNMAEPFAGLPIISYYLLIKNMKNKVILDGSGLDEAHHGYDKYLINEKKYNFSIFQDGSNYETQYIISNNLYNKYKNSQNEFKDHFEESYLNNMYNDVFYAKLPRALRFRDNLSMTHAVELRPSFLQKKLILSFFKLKKEEHYKNKYGKYFLRTLFKKNLGNDLAFRKKQNIQTPQTTWFRTDLSKWLENYIKRTEIWDMGWIDKKNFLKHYNLFINKKINNSFFIWQLINLDKWKNII
jgi:asparagine synthase (glutamine-hydrolysing)